MSEMISVIVPVYNAEKYIEKCIKSLVAQSYTNIEILLIDDGSNDASLSIMQWWQKKDKRIRVVQQKNCGVSSARNTGLREANGQYIQFVDSDDTVSSTFCENMINGIANKDICVCGITEIVDENNLKNKKLNLSEYNQCESVDEIAYRLFEKDLLNSPTNKLYKANLIKDAFLEDMTMGEDLLFNIHYLEKCQSISVLPMCLYQYVRNPESSTRKFRKNMSYMQCKIYQSLYSFFDKLPNECKMSIDRRFFEHMIQLVFKRAMISHHVPYRDRVLCVNEGLENPLFVSLMQRIKPKNFKDVVWMILLRTKLIRWVLI